MAQSRIKRAGLRPAKTAGLVGKRNFEPWITKRLLRPWLNWIEHQPTELVVGGSNPPGRAEFGIE